MITMITITVLATVIMADDVETLKPVSNFVSYSTGEWTDFGDTAQHRSEHSIQLPHPLIHTHTACG
jgi:hypothetical protein